MYSAIAKMNSFVDKIIARIRHLESTCMALEQSRQVLHSKKRLEPEYFSGSNADRMNSFLPQPHQTRARHIVQSENIDALHDRIQSKSWVLVTALVMALVACGEGHEASTDTDRPVITGTASPPLPASSIDTSPPTAASSNKEVIVVLRDIVRILGGPDLKTPARVNFLATAPDNTGRLFVVDLDGLVHLVDKGVLAGDPFLDMAKTRGKAFVHDDMEKGLSSIAFHPDFAKPGTQGYGRVYSASTETPDSGTPDFPSPDPSGTVSHHDVIAQWRVDGNNSNRIDPSSRREVLRIAHPHRDHTIGQIAFDPTILPGDPDYGLLYVGVGDGGNTVPEKGETDAFRTAQNGQLPFGKILRIDPIGDGSRRYSVPPDNPFVGNEKFLGEVWAYGLRNPQRFSWDSGEGHQMFIADIGQAQVEEINLGSAGGNYGWSEREGTFATRHRDETQLDTLPLDDAAHSYIYPVVQYRHDLGLAISGGFVYRGRLLPALQGAYVFGDIADGHVFFVDAGQLANGKPPAIPKGIRLKYFGQEKSLLEIVGKSRADLHFGMDGAGELYILTKTDGMVRKFSMVVP